jgi:hypothetical protein
MARVLRKASFVAPMARKWPNFSETESGCARRGWRPRRALTSLLTGVQPQPQTTNRQDAMNAKEISLIGEERQQPLKAPGRGFAFFDCRIET